MRALTRIYPSILKGSGRHLSVITRGLQEEVETGKRRNAVRKFIKESDSSYGAPIDKGEIGGDAFLTGPYVRGARLRFDQGNDAAEESLRRKIDPATTSVIKYIL
jgi:hypothetical protein